MTHGLVKAAAIVVGCAWLCAAAVPEHLIRDLPGIDNAQIKFKQYAGYVTVNEAKGRNFFYWFVESQNSPATDPLLLWLNGGPGSSSLIGFFVEHGPFRNDKNGVNLTLNPYAWNRVANVLYVESPSYVGFSYSGDAGDWKTDDDTVAGDNYEFVRRWLALYPEYRKNDFYVTGESYGGHYVPQLCEQILEKDTRGEINLRGLMAGNAAVNSDWYELGTADPRTDAWSFLTFMHTHGIVPHGAYAAAAEQCGWAHYASDCAGNYTRPSAACLAATTAALAYIPDDIDIYNVDAPACLDDAALSYTRRWSLAAHVVAQRRAALRHSRSAQHTIGVDADFDPCAFSHMVAYLNRADVQAAIHARVGTKWSGFADLDYSAESMHRNIIPLFRKFLATPRSQRWRILVYSGDADAAVPFLGTQKWVHCLSRPVKRDWRPWYHNRQFAGAAIDYDGITFLTVHGSGHAIPWYTPALGFEFYQRWLLGKDF